MSRTYTDTPEPRYVERAKYADNGGGGGDLPEPTIADEGKVLGVNDQGKYALVEGGGGSNGLIVNFVYDTEEPPTIIALDKTYNEITTVLNAGGCVRAKNVTVQAQTGATMTSVDYLDIVSSATINFDNPSMGTQYGVFIKFKNGDTYTFTALSPDGTLETAK